MAWVWDSVQETDSRGGVFMWSRSRGRDDGKSKWKTTDRCSKDPMLVLECDRQPLAHWQVDYRVRVGAGQQGQWEVWWDPGRTVWPGGEWGQCRGNYLLQAPLGIQGQLTFWSSQSWELTGSGPSESYQPDPGTPHCLGAHCPQNSTESQTPAESFSPLSSFSLPSSHLSFYLFLPLSLFFLSLLFSCSQPLNCLSYSHGVFISCNITGISIHPFVF